MLSAILRKLVRNRYSGCILRKAFLTHFELFHDGGHSDETLHDSRPGSGGHDLLQCDDSGRLVPRISWSRWWSRQLLGCTGALRPPVDRASHDTRYASRQLPPCPNHDQWASRPVHPWILRSAPHRPLEFVRASLGQIVTGGPDGLLAVFCRVRESRLTEPDGPAMVRWVRGRVSASLWFRQDLQTGCPDRP